MMKRIELLAPCGNYESFLAAANAGADAVYLGGKQFGARAYADNFSGEELIKTIYQAHLSGMKVYMTVNTLLKEQEMETLCEYLYPFYEAGLDGVIVQDMGALCLLRKNFPELELHASTQMTITGAYGASCLKSLGCSRIVPARELSLDEIRTIKEKVSIEVETFIHGAMCYCYSGQCLMSSMIGGRSGNRGRCAQPCRLPYRVAGKEGYFLSLKDMNTLEHLPALIEAGIDSFKIEGRMKRPEYVAGVVSVYRKYIDCYYEERDKADTGKRKFVVLPEDKRIVSGLYIRGETGNGYYDKARGRDMVTIKKPGYNEVDAALLKRLREKYIRELPGVPIRMAVKCRVGEPLRGEVRVFLPEHHNGNTDRLNGKESGMSEKEALREVCLTVFGPVVERADNREISEEEIRAQMVRTGGTPFMVSDCRAELGENCFVPVKWLKELRRNLLEEIYIACGGRTRKKKACPENTAAADDREKGMAIGNFCRKKSPDLPILTAVVQTGGQFQVLFDKIQKRLEESKGEHWKSPWKEYLIVDADLLLEDEKIRAALFAGEVYWGIKCPVIIRKQDEAFLKKLRALIEEGKPDILYCATIDVLAWVKSISWQGEIAGEASLYAWNREACFFWEKELDRISVPMELKSTEIRDICMAGGDSETQKSCPSEAFVYGRTALMISANCIKLTTGQCDKNRRRYTECKDRLGNIFPIYTDCAHCYNVIYNCLPFSAHENLWMFWQDGIRSFRMEFTLETGEQAGQIWQTFQKILASEIEKERTGGKTPGREKREKKGKLTGTETTTGRLRQGVE